MEVGLEAVGNDHGHGKYWLSINSWELFHCRPRTYFRVLGVLIKGTSYVFQKMPLVHVILPLIMKAIHLLIIFINLFVY